MVFANQYQVLSFWYLSGFGNRFNVTLQLNSYWFWWRWNSGADLTAQSLHSKNFSCLNLTWLFFWGSFPCSCACVGFFQWFWFPSTNTKCATSVDWWFYIHLRCLCVRVHGCSSQMCVCVCWLCGGSLAARICTNPLWPEQDWCGDGGTLKCTHYSAKDCLIYQDCWRLSENGENEQIQQVARNRGVD